MPKSSGEVCRAQDDLGTKCQNIMTLREKRDDDMCERCAEGIWDWIQSNFKKPFIMKNPSTREF